MRLKDSKKHKLASTSTFQKWHLTTKQGPVTHLARHPSRGPFSNARPLAHKHGASDAETVVELQSRASCSQLTVT